MNNSFISSVASQQVVGYRFHPTDPELIIHYLEPKVRDVNYQNLIIGVVDICKFEPWDLPSLSRIKSSDPVWYFYCVGEKKSTKSKQSNRTTKKGYWKSTGKLRLIKSRRTKKVIGSKRSLVYHFGRPKGRRTEWVMHEYKWISDSSVTKQQENIVLCKLKKKLGKKFEKDETNHHNINMGLAFDCENQELDDMRSMASMPSQDIADTNYLLSCDSTNQSILKTTTTNDLGCDGSDLSFHITSTNIISLGGMTTNATQGISVSNLEIPNLDKQDSTSTTSSTNFGILSQQEKVDDVSQQEKVDDISTVDGLMASDLLYDLDTWKVDDIWALVDFEYEDIANVDSQMPLCFEESNSLQQYFFQTPLPLCP